MISYQIPLENYRLSGNDAYDCFISCDSHKSSEDAYIAHDSDGKVISSAFITGMKEAMNWVYAHEREFHPNGSNH